MKSFFVPKLDNFRGSKNSKTKIQRPFLLAIVECLHSQKLISRKKNLIGSKIIKFPHCALVNERVMVTTMPLW